MRFIELYFNPEKKEYPDSVFNSFCYEPENIYEKRRGYLFIVGELKNPLPSNLKLLSETANCIKENYYSSPVRYSPEKSFKEALKEANLFLEKITRKGQVSWLGNFNMAVLNILPQKNNRFIVNFSKVGNIKVFLLRLGYVINIGKNLDFSEIEPYPLKVFGNIVLGRILVDEIVTIITKDVFDYFSENNLLAALARESNFNKNKVESILKSRKKDLDNLYGVCLFCVMENQNTSEQKQKSSIFFGKTKEKFSLGKIVKDIFSLNRIKQRVTEKMSSLFKVKKIILSRKRLSDFRLSAGQVFNRKNVILIVMFILLLLIGIMLF